jgi:stage II sporulation protein D
MNSRRVLGAAMFAVFALVGLRADSQSEVSVGVFGLFHPAEIVVHAERGHALTVSGGGAHFLLNGERLHQEVRFRAEHGRVIAMNRAAQEWTIKSRGGGAARIELAVPGKIRRVFTGAVSLSAHHNELIAVVTMDRELAVASIVAAEMPVDAPVEALKAQAVVTRSFLVTGKRHDAFEFCDTTHCQYLRSSDEVTKGIADAVAATRGVVLTFQQRPVAAMYSSRCGGTTQSLRDAGADAGNGYPYYAVECAWCKSHPVHWKSRMDSSATVPAPGNEWQRIRAARLQGWGALPGNRLTAEQDSSGIVVSGRSVGHGIGMCQLGAIAMARGGADYRTILAHYYPNTELAESR